MEYKETPISRAISIAIPLGIILLLEWLFPSVKPTFNYIMYGIISVALLFEIWKRNLYIPFFIEVDTWYKKAIVILDKYAFGFFLGTSLLAMKMPIVGGILNGIVASFILFRFLKYGSKHGRLK